MEPMDFYIGQKFYQPYPSAAKTWCDNNNAEIVEKYEEEETESGIIQIRYYEIIEKPEPPVPTKEEIRQKRIEYRREHIDNQTLERDRRKANGTWTEEDEIAYLALDAEVTAYIEENLPYPTDPII